MRKSPRRVLYIRMFLFLVMLTLLLAEFWAEGKPKFKYFTIIGVYLTFITICLQIAVSLTQLKEIEDYKRQKINEVNSKIIN